ncbi:lysozyme [Methylocystis parvus]|uniref:lysozyme n=1 Tax=Methylocystis parvus TaxID=134 RepID=UPI003C78B5CC
MQMSAQGRALLIQREGFKTKVYKDSVGVLTIGVGHTSAAGPPFVTPGMVIGKAEVDAILTRDLRKFESAVVNAVTVPMTQGQFDALVSLCFNIGTGGFRNSTVVRRLNAGNYRGAGDAFLMWNKPPEITGRRKGERAQFLAATEVGQTGAPVRFIAADDLHEDEGVSVDYLRASGSRTVTLADKIKNGAATIGVGDAMSAAAQAKDYAQQARDLAQGWDAGAPTIELLKTYAPLFIALGVTVTIAALVFIAWRAASRIQAARVEDAVFAAGGGEA